MQLTAAVRRACIDAQPPSGKIGLPQRQKPPAEYSESYIASRHS